MGFPFHKMETSMGAISLQIDADIGFLCVSGISELRWEESVVDLVPVLNCVLLSNQCLLNLVLRRQLVFPMYFFPVVRHFAWYTTIGVLHWPLALHLVVPFIILQLHGRVSKSFDIILVFILLVRSLWNNWDKLENLLYAIENLNHDSSGNCDKTS
jgi:hypothetical protein